MSNKEKALVSGSAIVIAGTSLLVMATYAVTTAGAYSYEDSYAWTALASSNNGRGSDDRKGREEEKDRGKSEDRSRSGDDAVATSDSHNRGRWMSERWVSAVSRHIDVKNLKYLLNLVARLERVRANVSNSHMEPTRKAEFLAQMDMFIARANQRIAELTGAWGSDVNDSVSAALSVYGITSDSVRAFVRLSNNTVGYYVVTKSGAVDPSAAQIRSGQDGLSQTGTVVASGSVKTRNAAFKVSGLMPTTGYSIHFFAENVLSKKQTDVIVVDFETLASAADVTPPAVSSVSATGVTNSGATLAFASSESGTGYYVVVPNGSPVPSSVQVMNGQNGSGTAASVRGSWAVGTGSNSFPITGLSPSTAYVAYLVVKDAGGNLQMAPVSVSFTTSANPDTVPPTVTALSVTWVTNSGATLAFASSESGTGYYVVLPNGSSAPTAEHIRLGHDGSWMTAAVKGNSATVSWNNSLAVTGLMPATEYVAYLAVADAMGNLETTAHALGFTTSN